MIQNHLKLCNCFSLQPCRICNCYFTRLIPHISRTFSKPPRPVQLTAECIVILRGIKEVSWKTAKQMMSESNFLKSLQDLDVDGIGSGQVGCENI